MTLVIALRCSDGIIMASDSQGTEESGDVRYPVQKVYRLTSRSTWGGAGHVQVMRELSVDLQAEAELLEQAEIPGTFVRDRIKPILEGHYRAFIDGVPGLSATSPATWVLTAGYTPTGKPFISEVDPRCMYSSYEERGFHAIGSAAGFAQVANSLLLHFNVAESPLDHGLLVAYHTMRVAVDTAASGVGGDIQMWISTAEETHQVAPDELKEIENNVNAWKAIERDSLNQLFSPGREPDVAMPSAIPPTEDQEGT